MLKPSVKQSHQTKVQNSKPFSKVKPIAELTIPFNGFILYCKQEGKMRVHCPKRNECPICYSKNVDLEGYSV